MSTVLVTGGTGRLGRHLVPALADAGHRVRVLSRTGGAGPGSAQRAVGDLATGTGLDEAVRGVDVVLHLASDPKRLPQVDVAGTDALLDAAQRAGVSHLVFLSIVGCDRNPLKLYQAKCAAEAMVLDGRVPGTVLRASQFHDFVAQLAEVVVIGPLAFVPRGLRSQLVDLREVADRLVQLVEQGPSGRVRDLVGPQAVPAADALVRWCRATGRRVPRLVPVPAVGGVAKAFAAGSNLGGTDAEVGRRTYDEWLAEQRAP